MPLNNLKQLPTLKEPSPATQTLRIHELFFSIQGESSYAGLPFIFIRLTGCNLRCTYCDTEYAFTGGRTLTFEEIFASIATWQTPWVEITGGEPLLQAQTPALAQELLERGYRVLIETSGAEDISRLDPRVIKIMDLKCPGSGEVHRNRYENLQYLNPADEIKLVISNREDYLWAKALVEKDLKDSPCTILFSPNFEVLNNQLLASWILADHLPVRFQLQMHKYIWDPNCRGV